ncbi:MAG: O-methyltransferase [Tannerella sp.]|nr:O-methyltransferase [Tannerella sp.]
MFITNYLLSHIDDESPLLAALSREAHVKLLRPRMMAGHLQGRILKMFCRMIRPKRVLEIGTYTAYSTLCMAEGLDDDALIHSIEINDEMEPFIRPYLDQSPDKYKIRIHWGDALDLIPSLNEQFDLVFIDGDKREYCEYYDITFPYVRPGRIILADNTLWDSKVTENIATIRDLRTQGIIAFNEKIKHDPRIEKVILPLRDGLTVIYKL